MLQCTNCDRQQESGKFCGACGSSLEEVVTPDATVDPEAQPTNENETEETQEQGNSSSENQTDETAGANVQDGAEVEQTAQPEQPEQPATEVNEQASAERESAATMTGQNASTQQTSAASSEPADTSNAAQRDYKAEVKKYWQYSLEVLKSPGKAFGHKEDKFVYGIVNLVLYALTFSLIILSLVRGVYKRTLGGFGSELGIDMTGLFTKMTLYLFVGTGIALILVLLSLLIVEKTMIKKMTFKQILVQYSGLLIPFIFLQIAVLLFSLIGSSFVTILFVYISLFYGLFFLTGIFMYEKVTFYGTSTHKVYTAVGTTVFVVVVFAVATFVFGMSFIENITDMLDDLSF